MSLEYQDSSKTNTQLMIKEFWINLPVKDLKNAMEFYSKIGFSFNPQHANSGNSACMLIGEKKNIIMLFEEKTFMGFTNTAIADTKISNEVLLSIDAQSKEEVDAIVQKVLDAGGKSNHKPQEMKSWMYGCLFTDLDGHRWNVLFMDMTKMQEIHP